MLFHRGEYLGTASYDAFGYAPTITRVDNSTLHVTFHYPLEGDGDALPGGAAESTFTWDAATARVVHAGQFPPELLD